MLSEDNNQPKIRQDYEEDDPIMQLELDEPIVAVWLAEDSSNIYAWHVGFVHETMDNRNVSINYLKKASHDGVRWNAPEEAKIYLTSYNQIMLRLNSVHSVQGRLKSNQQKNK